MSDENRVALRKHLVLSHTLKTNTLVCLLLFFALSAWAGDLEVTVRDPEIGIPLEGVRIVGENVAEARTKADGRAILKISEGVEKLKVTVSLPGYETKIVTLNTGGGAVSIELTIANVVEGTELVVEKPKPQSSDAELGVSVVASQEQIAATSNIGVVEDVMSTIKSLPGVGYDGGWNALPSIRGGDPSETTTVLDGISILYPYHWGGAVSIFDPNMVESAKLSEGIISARYGNVMSGLIEVSSKAPLLSQPRLDFELSTSAVDLTFQSPVGANAGFSAGGKFTWIGLPYTLLGQKNFYSTFPFIRDAYVKAFWNPMDRAKWYANFFIGTDGVHQTNISGNITPIPNSLQDFSWSALSIVGSTGLRLLLGDSHMLEFKAAVNHVRLDESNSTGDIGQFSENSTISTLLETYQGSVEWDWELANRQILSLGLETMLKNLTDVENQDYWAFVLESDGYHYLHQQYKIQTEGNHAISPGAFAIYRFDLLPNKLSGEAGVRFDYSYLYNNDMSLSAAPTLNPRLRLVYKPFQGKGWLDGFSLSLGGGLFTQFPIASLFFSRGNDLANEAIGPERAWVGLIGGELVAQEGWKVSLEGYYKAYSNRLYIFEDIETNPATIHFETDGEGFAYGADLMIQKTLGRYWDGWISYSFIEARYYNPTKPYNSNLTTLYPAGAPLGTWYYPSYQRFHNLNLVFDWKPSPDFVVTTKASLASGAPKARAEQVTLETATVDSNTTAQFFSAPLVYDDYLRNDISFNVDLKLTWSGFFPSSKIRWELYFGVENLLAPLYSPKTTGVINPITGQQIPGSDNADFTIGVPIPSFGFKLSY